MEGRGKGVAIAQTLMGKPKMILIVGASGLGKDSLLREVQKHFSRHKQQGIENVICFVKCYIKSMRLKKQI